MKNRSGDREAVQIRTSLKPGDIGYITYLHGTLYAREYGLDYTLDGYVAEGLARFVLSFDAKKDCLWLAEEQGTNRRVNRRGRGIGFSSPVALVYCAPGQTRQRTGAKAPERCH